MTHPPEHYWCETCDAGAEGCNHPLTPVRYVRNGAGQTVRLSPCKKPEHIEKFEWGYAVVGCKECVMEVVPA